MRPEYEQRFRRIVSDFIERPAGDYGELLRRGHVSSPDGVDPEQWRAEIRAQARRDKIRVVTFRDGDRAIAARNRTASDQDVRDELDRMQALRELATKARALGHEPGPWLRSDEENICLCSRCDARLYLPRRRLADQRRRGDCRAVPGTVVRTDHRLTPVAERPRAQSAVLFAPRFGPVAGDLVAEQREEPRRARAALPRAALAEHDATGANALRPRRDWRRQLRAAVVMSAAIEDHGRVFEAEPELLHITARYPSEANRRSYRSLA